MSDVLLRLVELLRSSGGLLAGAVSEAQQSGGPSPARAVAAGPRAAAAREEYELLTEAIYEGYLLHYGEPRILHTPDRDLALLAGDHLYALGLARLVELGDIEAVAELADVISLAALARSAGDLALAEAVWEAGARAVGWGAGAAHRRAKELARSGDAGALGALRALVAQPV